MLRSIWQPLDHIFTLCDTDNRYTRNFSDPPLQVSIVCRYNVYPVLDNPVHDAVVCICTLVVALQSLPSFVTRYPQSYPVFGPEFFQFGHDAGCDYGSNRGVQTVHHGLQEVEFVVNSMGEKVGIDQDRIWRLKSFVVHEEHV